MLDSVPYADDVRAELAALDALEFLYRQLGIEAAIQGDTDAQGLALEGLTRIFYARQELRPYMTVADAVMISRELH